MGQWNDSPETTKFPIIKVYVNGYGEVVKVTDASGEPLTDEHYDTEEVGRGRKIEGNAVLWTPNGCRWRCINGRWVCVPI